MDFDRIAARRDHFAKLAIEVNIDDIVANHACIEVQSLLLHQLHQLDALHGVMVLPVSLVIWRGRKIVVAVLVHSTLHKGSDIAERKTGIVLDFSRKGKLAERNHFRLDRPLEY